MSRPWNRGQRSLKVVESGTIWKIVYGFLLVFFSNFVPKMHRFWDRFPKCRDLENRVRGPSRSLEISPVSRVCNGSKCPQCSKCPTKRPDMSDEIANSQQTMNQGNKISSVRPGTIGLDLYVLLFYKGPKKCKWYLQTTVSTTENNRKPGVHCNKERHQIMPFIFTGT